MIYETTNLYVSAALSAYGAKFLSASRDESGTVIFQFDDPEDTLDALGHSYYRNKFPVIQPADFVDQLMLMRDRLRAAQ